MNPLKVQTPYSQECSFGITPWGSHQVGTLKESRSKVVTWGPQVGQLFLTKGI